MAFNFETFPVLQTPRVTLRALKLDDAEPLLALRSSEEINKFVITKRIKICNKQNCWNCKGIYLLIYQC